MASLRREGAAGLAKASHNWSVSEKELFRIQLGKVLESSQFRSSKRCSVFLRCVGEHVIEDRIDSLKERTLGIEAFERDPAYDTDQDPVVRSTAVEVRKRLAQYYLDPGHETEPRISLPAGSYVAEIHPPPGKARLFSPWQFFFKFKKVWLATAGAVILSAAAAFIALNPRNTNLDRFWAPFTSSPQPIMICLGQPHTYVFVAPQQGRIREWFENHTGDRNPPADLASIPLQEVVPTWGQHIDISDAQAYERLATLFSKKGRTVQLRGDLSVALSELRRHPTILIGAFNNDWTLGLTGELRFYFQTDSEGQMVRDHQNPKKNEWRVVNAWPYRNIPQDYAIVTRVINPTTEQTVVIAAGITHFGTRAAVELVTDEPYFEAALRGASPDWRRKNMQVVISTKVMSGQSGPPQVLDRYFW
jgi:hypothetical protein